MNELINHIAQQLSSHFNQPIHIRSHQQVFGGDINQTFHLETTTGSFFFKLNDGKLKDIFEKEFEGLQVLYQTKTIKIPEPVLHGSFLNAVIPTKVGISQYSNQIYLVTEFLQKGQPKKDFWEKFAYQL